MQPTPIPCPTDLLFPFSNGVFPSVPRSASSGNATLGKDALGDSSSLDHMVPVGVHLSYVSVPMSSIPGNSTFKWMLDGPTLRLSDDRDSDTSTTTTETLVYQDVIQSYMFSDVLLYSISYTSTVYSSPNNNRNHQAVNTSPEKCGHLQVARTGDFFTRHHFPAESC